MSATSWGRVSATGVISEQLGISRVERISTGRYQIFLETPFESPDYVVVPRFDEAQGSGSPPYSEVDARQLGSFIIEWRLANNSLANIPFTFTIYSSEALVIEGGGGGGGTNITPVPYLTGDPHYWVEDAGLRNITLVLHDVDITPTNENTDNLIISIDGFFNYFIRPWPIATASRRITITVPADQAETIEDNAEGFVNFDIRLRDDITDVQRIRGNLPIVIKPKSLALIEDINSENIVNAVNGDPLDTQIIEYDQSNQRLTFVDKPSGGGSGTGPRGPAGPAGRDGSDASVTIANIIRAIGGRPQDEQVLTYESSGNTLEWQDQTGGTSTQPPPINVNQIMIPATISGERSIRPDGTSDITVSTITSGPYATMGMGDDAGKIVFSRNGILKLGVGITCRVSGSQGRVSPTLNVSGTGIQVLARTNGYYRSTNVNRLIFRSVDVLVTAGATGTLQITNPTEAQGQTTLLYSALSHIVMFAHGGTQGDKGEKGDKGDRGDRGLAGSDGSNAMVTVSNMLNAIGGNPQDEQVLTFEASDNSLKWEDPPMGGGGGTGGTDTEQLPFILFDPHYWVDVETGRSMTFTIFDLDITPENESVSQLLVNVEGYGFRVPSWPIATANRRQTIEIPDAQAKAIADNSQGNVPFTIRLQDSSGSNISTIRTSLPIITPQDALARVRDIPAFRVVQTDNSNPPRITQFAINGTIYQV